MSTSDFSVAAHRTFRGDFYRRARLRRQPALEGDRPIDLVNLALSCFTFGAVRGVDLQVMQPDENVRAVVASTIDLRLAGYLAGVWPKLR